MAMSTAMEAMTASGELGALMSFVRSSMGANEVSILADELINTLEQFGLSGCLMISQLSGYKLFGCEEGSMEGKVLLGVNESKSIYEFGKRTIFLRDKVRLLIKNMPYDQEARYGRLKDNLLVLFDCASSRASSLMLLHGMQHDRDQLMEQIIQRSETQLGSVRQKLTHQAEETQRVMSKLVHQLDERLMFLGLDDD